MNSYQMNKQVNKEDLIELKENTREYLSKIQGKINPKINNIVRDVVWNIAFIIELDLWMLEMGKELDISEEKRKLYSFLQMFLYLFSWMKPDSYEVIFWDLEFKGTTENIKAVREKIESVIKI